MDTKLAPLSEQELFDALDGLKAYDSGALDSGIQDADLRRRVISYLRNLSDRDADILISRYIRDQLLSEHALRSGYGLEDVASFVRWLQIELGLLGFLAW